MRMITSPWVDAKIRETGFKLYGAHLASASILCMRMLAIEADHLS